MKRQDKTKSADDVGASYQPAFPVRPGENEIETLWMFEIPDQQGAGSCQEQPRKHRRSPLPQRSGAHDLPEQHQEQRYQIDTGSNAFGQGVQADSPIPGHAMRHVVAQQGRGRAAGLMRVTRHDVMRAFELFAPDK